MDEHYINPKLAALYDYDSPWSIDREFYLNLAGEKPLRILDLGCGTGLLCDAYAAQGHEVTGVDPAQAMLNVARNKPHGAKIEWVHCAAQAFKSDSQFDLIVMTGHAFQAIIEQHDIEATVKVMHDHLADDGRIVFESRNPHVDWRKDWDYDMPIKTPLGMVSESRRFISLVDALMTFDLIYKFDDEILSSKSKLRFLSSDEITTLLNSADLRVDKFFGDWDGSPFDALLSKEMILIAKKKNKR